ncbi:DmsC/YnfH family molybdoenzyme membrane anchor subunit [Mesorhizobium sp. CAU 1732]|uniref:dimethyl sulfoxide reductase anchor subunit family protein n=1 Tax=Mesorhizobium sp. CAU 1732 TaxID=3140358 RepID=UPI003260E03F
MHPALSIIAFTTMSGLGYGLAIMLGLGFLDPSLAVTKVAHVVALMLIGGGLLSSTLHLGNPQRAWRALSQWRTSWLSREGVLAILTFIPLCMSAYAAIFQSRHLPISGLLGAAGAAATIYCTAMIYGSLKSVQAWHTPLTPACYLLFAGAGGGLLGLLVAIIGGNGALFLMLVALVFLIAAWTTKFYWRRNMQTLQPLSTPESATGLGDIGRVKLFQSPHGNDSYLTREMGFVIARKHAKKLAAISFILGGVMPAVLIVAILIAGAEAYALAIVLAVLAVVSHVIGMLTERWLFFAEAKHAVMNYY